MFENLLERGKLTTWGSADEEGQSYLVSGKHEVIFDEGVIA